MRWRGPPRIMEKDLNYPLLGVWNGLETSSDSSHGEIWETKGLFKLCALSNVMGKVWFAGQLLAGCGWWCISWYLPYLPFPQLIFRYIDHLLEKCVGLESYFRNLLDTVFSFAFSLDCRTFFLLPCRLHQGKSPLHFAFVAEQHIYHSLSSQSLLHLFVHSVQIHVFFLSLKVTNSKNKNMN